MTGAKNGWSITSSYRVGDRVAWLGFLAGLACTVIFSLKAVPGSPLRAEPVALGFQRKLDSPSATQAGTSANLGQTSVCSIDSTSPSRPSQPSRSRTKSIEDIQPGDLVLAKDPDTGEVAAKRVIQTFRRTADHLRTLRIESADAVSVQHLQTTDDHPFWVVGQGWVAAGRIGVGQWLLQSDGRPGTLVGTHRNPYATGIPVFNFEVEDIHTYFVCAASEDPSVLAHNHCYELHHIFPKQWESNFIKNGIDIEKYLVKMRVSAHRELHSDGWNKMWKKWIDDHANEFSVAEAQDYALELIQLYGLWIRKVYSR